MQYEKSLNKPYLVDGHMHLEHGDLSEEYVMRFVEEAVKKGIDERDFDLTAYTLGCIRDWYDANLDEIRTCDIVYNYY